MTSHLSVRKAIHRELWPTLDCLSPVSLNAVCAFAQPVADTL
jgi:hypothetical protein